MKKLKNNILSLSIRTLVVLLIIIQMSTVLPIYANVNDSEKPNFIIIFTDDLGYNDLGCFGSEKIKTPKIDELAQEGMKLAGFYSQPVCGPARAALLTGCYPLRVDGGGWNVGTEEITIAEVLKTVGYKTACIGKWDISGRKYKEGMVPNDQWKLTLPDRKEFFRYAKDKKEVEKPELYNLVTDISETRDVASEHPDRVQELLGLAEEARRDIGDSERIGINSRNISSDINNKNYTKLKTVTVNQVDNLQNLIDEMSDSLWIYAETALQEYKSSQLLISKLREAGFSVESGVADMPTAFVATYGTGSPVIGILAEYDALPGVGNEPVPHRQLRNDGITSGHGCGHNLFGAASVGAALALKKTMVDNNLKGTIKLFGTPAEETVVGKVYMARAGIFNGLDAVIDWHPGTKNKVKNQPGRAMNSFEVEFFGQAAHGSADPWNGRSALDAVELMNYAVNMMREHVKPTARIHYVIPNAGEAPNVVPEYAKVWYYVRDIDRDEVQKLYDRILKITEAAAMATETTHKVRLITGVHEYLLNRPMQEA